MEKIGFVNPIDDIMCEECGKKETLRQIDIETGYTSSEGQQEGTAKLFAKVSLQCGHSFKVEVDHIELFHKIKESSEIKEIEIPEISRCGNPDHIGLAVKCPTRKHQSACAECLGCLLEMADDITCGPSIHLHYKDKEKPELLLLENIDDDYFKKLPDAPDNLFKIIYRISRQANKFRTLKKLLKECD